MIAESHTITHELTVGAVLSNLKSQIKNSGLNITSLDLHVLLTGITGKDRAWLLAHPEAHLSQEQHQMLTDAFTRLANGEPLPYILGHWDFFTLDFLVSPQTLIPRPETEHLVEQALSWLRAYPGPKKAADIGTGSGCIATTLAVNNPDLQVTAVDISPAALEIAAANVSRHGVASQVQLVEGDLLGFAPRHTVFDLITANLPYIPTGTLVGLDVYHHEPVLALDGGPDGLDLIRRLLPQAVQVLPPQSLMLLEIEASLGLTVMNLAQEHFPGAKIDLLTDLAGLDRLIRIENTL